MKHHILLTVTYIVFLLSSCAYQGEYYANDKISTRYGMWGGVNRSQTQKNRDGRGDSRFREPMWYSANGWNSEPRAKKSDSFEQANLTSDLTRMRTGSPRSGRFDLKRTKSIEKYEDKVTSRVRKDVNISYEIKKTKKSHAMKDAKKDARNILKIEKKVASDPERYKECKEDLLEVELTMKKAYRQSVRKRLRMLQEIFKDIHDKHLMGLCGTSSGLFSLELLEQLRTMKPEFREAPPAEGRPYPFNCGRIFDECSTYYLTDGQEHCEKDYTFTYLFGDPKNVSDKITERIGNTSLNTLQKAQSTAVQASLAKAEAQDRLEESRDALELRRKELQDKYEELRETVIRHRHFGVGRILNAFPDAKHRDYDKILSELKNRLSGK